MNYQASMNQVNIYNRDKRFHQTNQALPHIFPEAGECDASQLQLVVTRGAMYLLDVSVSSPGKRKVILSSDGKLGYNAEFQNQRIKPKKQGNGYHVRHIFDISEQHLEAAMAIILANSYPVLREEQIAMQHRALLANYGYLSLKEDEYPSVKLAA